MKLSTKIQLFSTAMLLLLLLGVNAGIYLLFRAQVTESEVERMEGKAESIVRAINASGVGREKGSATQLLRAYLPESGMIRVVNDRATTLLTVTEQPELVEEISPAFRNRQDHRFFNRGNGMYITASYPLIWENGQVVTLEITESVHLLERNLQILRWVLFLATLIVLAPTIMGGILLSRLILRPIHSLIQTMESNRRQGTFQRLEIKQRSKDELYQMAVTYNRMMDWMEESFHKQLQFVSDASHELKTPLTVIESYANLLKRWGSQKPDVRDEAIEAIHSEAKRMRELTHQMLDLARDDTHELLNLTSVNLGEICRETVRSLVRVAGRSIQVSSEDDVQAQGDPEKLKQLLFILLDNALKYSEDEVFVRVTSFDGGARVQVEDQGKGIPEEDQERVFERFYRVEKARSRETGGSGLGLSIAKRIVEAHRGCLSLESEMGRGTVVTVRLPSPDREK
ncbi:sensor histidine kinase YkoH [Kroppenstedtia guangzhouensis]|uniref:histidine kinase n=1 Tax=Kroppenstedtia guangzhouensis TaxID=1274356 RepID=A0ABQ1H6H2_9BACL|nr:HAMP domain-containing sensor histidine kinase [Kroppenstedtia guangzhouensis]GGA59239.1 sensor histidine kinase YkoH [Kroppenstedtia guangzhouensis]